MLSMAVNTAQTLAAVEGVFGEFDYVLDPHTAVGYAAAKAFALKISAPIVCVATAHPAKFPEAVCQAVPTAQVVHPTLEALKGLPERKRLIAANVDAVKDVIRSQLA